MRVFLTLLVLACATGAALKYKDGNAPESQAGPATAAVAQPVTAAKEPSTHNWPKRSLDRAADVKRQVAAAQRDNDAK